MGLLEKIKEFNKSENFWIGLIRDFLFIISIIAIFSSVSMILFGVWTPVRMVAVESGSMIPHIQIGDIIFIESIGLTNITTYEEGELTGYKSFNNYGDVILYKKLGGEGGNPIIHRAMYYVETGQPMWLGGPPAPHAGYITKGDNARTNPMYDQQGEISYMQPVKKEWIIGKARFYRVPLLGYISLIPRKILGV